MIGFARGTPTPVCDQLLNALRNNASSVLSRLWQAGDALWKDERGMWGLPGLAGIDPISGFIKSVQQVSITIANGNSSNTATITPVNTSYAFIVYQGTNAHRVNPGNTGHTYVRVALTNATTVTATREGTQHDVTVNCTVIEATPSLVQSVQFGVVTGTNVLDNTATISSVSTGRTAVFYLGKTGGGLNHMGHNGGVTLTNSTTVTGYVGDEHNWTIGFVVVQFQQAVIKTRQQYASTYTTANATDTQAISSVDTNNTMIAYGGQIQEVDTSTDQYYLQLTSATNVNLVRTATSSNTRTVYFTVIEFNRSCINQNVQRGTITLNNVTSNTATITSSNVNRTLCNYLAFNCAQTIDFDREQLALTLTNATTITATVDTAQASNHIISYEAIEFLL